MKTALAIGDFARATHLSVKALRHYHELGLLVPSKIDRASGYRSYATEQIASAQIIRRFRDLDMPLDEIRAVLQAPDLVSRNALIGAHLARLERGLAQTQEAVGSLRRLLEGPPASIPIIHRSEGALEVAAVTAEVALDDLSAWFQGAIGEVHATLAAQRVTPAGPAGSVVSTAFFGDEHGELTVFIPVTAPFRSVGRVAPRTLPGVELATIVHDGEHGDIDRAYGALAAYVTERAVGLDGPIRERYIVGRHETADVSAWRTEIGWPVFVTSVS
jgi:DNA-binding transcriptional MerR regulator